MRKRGSFNCRLRIGNYVMTATVSNELNYAKSSGTDADRQHTQSGYTRTGRTRNLPAFGRGSTPRYPEELVMSALSQKRTLQCVPAMSALPPKADIGTGSWNVRFVPKADICSAAKSITIRSHRR